MKPSPAKPMPLALLIALIVGSTMLIRLGFALLRYSTDLKLAPNFGGYLEEAVKNIVSGGIFLYCYMHRRTPWYLWVISIPVGSLVAGIACRVIAGAFGHEFYRCLLPNAFPSMGGLFLSQIPALLVMSAYVLISTYYRRWK